MSLMDDGLPPISALASKIITPLVNLWTYPQLRVELTRKDVGLVSALFALLRRSAEVDDDSALTSDVSGDEAAGNCVCSLEELHWVIQLLLALVVAPGWRDKEQLREFGVAWTCLESVRVVASNDHPNILVQQWKRMQNIADRLRASGMGGATGVASASPDTVQTLAAKGSSALSGGGSGGAGGGDAASAAVVRTLPQLAQTEHDLLLLLHALLKSPVEALRMARETDLLSMFSNLLGSLRDVHDFTTERDRHELSSAVDDFDRLGDEPTTSVERCGCGSRSAEFATLCVLSDALGALFAWLGPGGAKLIELSVKAASHGARGKRKGGKGGAATGAAPGAGGGADGTALALQDSGVPADMDVSLWLSDVTVRSVACGLQRALVDVCIVGRDALLLRNLMGALCSLAGWWGSMREIVNAGGIVVAVRLLSVDVEEDGCTASTDAGLPSLTAEGAAEFRSLACECLGLMCRADVWKAYGDTYEAELREHVKEGFREGELEGRGGLLRMLARLWRRRITELSERCAYARLFCDLSSVSVLRAHKFEARETEALLTGLRRLANGDRPPGSPPPSTVSESQCSLLQELRSVCLPRFEQLAMEVVARANADAEAAESELVAQIEEEERRKGNGGKNGKKGGKKKKKQKLSKREREKQREQDQRDRREAARLAAEEEARSKEQDDSDASDSDSDSDSDDDAAMLVMFAGISATEMQRARGGKSKGEKKSKNDSRGRGPSSKAHSRSGVASSQSSRGSAWQEVGVSEMSISGSSSQGSRRGGAPAFGSGAKLDENHVEYCRAVIQHAKVYLRRRSADGTCRGPARALSAKHEHPDMLRRRQQANSHLALTVVRHLLLLSFVSSMSFLKCLLSFLLSFIHSS